MSKIIQISISLISLFFLSGCFFLIDPMANEPKTGKEQMEGEIENISIMGSFSNTYNTVMLKKSASLLSFEKNNLFDDRILAQLETGDYVKFSANYDEKTKIVEITKKRQKNCKIYAITQYNQNNKQKFVKFEYLIENEKDEENCSKYTLREPKNMIQLERKMSYID